MILTSVISGAAGGFFISYVFPAKYTSQSTVLMEQQRVPESLVPNLMSDDFSVRLQTSTQTVLSSSNLRTILDRPIDQIKKDRNETGMIERIQQDMTLEPLVNSFAETTKSMPTGVTVSYVDSDPTRAQQICGALTESLLSTYERDQAERIRETISFFQRQLDVAEAKLEELDRPALAQGTGKTRTNTASDEASKMLSRDYDSAQKNYADLRERITQAKYAEQLNLENMGEHLVIFSSANLPTVPDFPDRTLFFQVGIGSGLIFGIGIVLLQRRLARRDSRVAILNTGATVSS